MSDCPICGHVTPCGRDHGTGGVGALLDDNARLRAALVGLLAANPLGRHQTDESSEWAWNELRGDLQDAWNVAVEQARAALKEQA